MTLQLMEDQLHINWEMICSILHKDLARKKICTKFVPHSLMDEQKEHRVKSCELFMQTCHTNDGDDDDYEDASFPGSYGMPTGKQLPAFWRSTVPPS
jgi:hypothetical protein